MTAEWAEETRIKYPVLEVGENGRLLVEFQIGYSKWCHVCRAESFTRATVFRKPGYSTYFPGETPSSKETIPIPELCPLCAPDEQSIYWRSFTEPARLFFAKNPDFVHPEFEKTWKQIQQFNGEPGALPINELLEQPGWNWLTNNFKFALGVGLARNIAQNTPVTLIGTTVCKHTLTSHRMFEVVDDSDVGSHSSVRQRLGHSLALVTKRSRGDIIDRMPIDNTGKTSFFVLGIDDFEPIARKLREVIGDNTNQRALQLKQFVVDVVLDELVAGAQTTHHSSIPDRSLWKFINPISCEQFFNV